MTKINKRKMEKSEARRRILELPELENEELNAPFRVREVAQIRFEYNTDGFRKVVYVSGRNGTELVYSSEMNDGTKSLCIPDKASVSIIDSYQTIKRLR